MTVHRDIIVTPDADALAHLAATRLLTRMDANAGRIAICLTGGSTPKRLYELLTTPPWRDRIPWQRTHWFMGDDRFVPQTDADSNIAMAKHAFLDDCAAPGTVHPIPTDEVDPDTAARAYQMTLQDFRGGTALDPTRPLFDMVLMGVGPDGHTASLFPGFPAAEETTRWVVGVPRANMAPFVPRVTLTFPVLASCREMLFLVSGAEKRDIAKAALSGDTLPASRAHSVCETVWVMDQAAAGTDD